MRATRTEVLMTVVGNRLLMEEISCTVQPTKTKEKTGFSSAIIISYARSEQINTVYAFLTITLVKGQL